MKARFATIDILGSDVLVERPSPNAAPTAFRIWAAGENFADNESIFFMENSAKLLLDEQSARGRLYPSDFDHLSLKTDRPAEAGRASGWHRIEVREDAKGKPELWAVGIEWCADAKAGLEEQPPRWRYFSPAFDVSKSGEVTSYINFALCINPLTHNLPALASVTSAPVSTTSTRKRSAMDPKQCAKHLAAMDAMLADLEDGDHKEKLTEARAAMAALMTEPPEKEPSKDPETKAEGDGNGGEAGSGSAEKDKDKVMTQAEAKPSDDDDDKTKTHAVTKVNAVIDAAVEAAVADRMRPIEIEALLRTRPDLTTAQRAWCVKQDVDTVKGFLQVTPKQHTVRNEKSAQGGGSSHAVPLLEGREREELDEGMGMNAHKARMPARQDDGTLVIHTVRPSDIRRELAAKEGK